MTRILNPNQDEDLAQILLHDTEVVMQKKSSRNPHGPNTKKGKIEKIKIGEPIVINGSLSGKTTELARVTMAHNIKEICLHTKNSIYQITGIEPGKHHRLMTLRYLRKGYLDFDEIMPDGFYDGGRHTQFELNQHNQLKPTSLGREFITVNANTDALLKQKLTDAEKLLKNIPDLKTRITMLAMYVSNSLGGTQKADFSDNDIIKLTEDEISAIQKKYQMEHVPLGYLQHGVCRHRALLFKYLADRLNIPSRIVRGDYGGPGGGHAWNVIQLDKQFFIVDVMHNPLEMIPENSDKARRYMRKDSRGNRGGFGGHSISRV